MNTARTFFTALVLLFLLAACSSEGKENSTESTSNGAEKPQTSSSNERPRLYLEPGATWMAKIHSTEKTKLKAGDDAQVSKLASVMKVKYLLENINKDQSYSIRVTFQEVQADYSGPDGKWSFNSQDPDRDKSVGAAYRAIAGKSINMMVEPLTGQVLDVRGGNEIYAGFENADMQSNGNRLFKEMMNIQWNVFPNGPVVKGDTWERKFEHSSGHNASYQYQFVYQGKENMRWKVQAKIKIGPAADPLANAFQKLKVQYHLEGNGNAQYELDEATGLILSSFRNRSMTGTMQMSEDGKVQETVPVAIETETSMEITKG